MTSTQDKAIFERVKQGDENALKMLFDMYYNPLCQYANTMLRDSAAAEDVVQQIFTNLWVQRSKIGIDEALKPYLYSAVRNATYNVFKHHKVRQVHHDYMNAASANQSPDGSEVLEAVELQQRITAAIEELPPQCRLIFSKSRFESLSYKEIADEMGLSVKTIENQMGKALRLMRESLRDYLHILIAFGFLQG